MMNIFGTLVKLISLGVNILCTLDIIMDLLKQQKKTQKDLTDFLGITKNAFTNWKNGNNTSYLKKLPEIADFFNVTTDYLLGKSKYKTADEKEFSELEFALLGEIHDLTQEEQQKILEFARFTKSQRNDKDDLE